MPFWPVYPFEKLQVRRLTGSVLVSLERQARHRNPWRFTKRRISAGGETIRHTSRASDMWMIGKENRRTHDQWESHNLDRGRTDSRIPMRTSDKKRRDNTGDVFVVAGRPGAS